MPLKFLLIPKTIFLGTGDAAVCLYVYYVLFIDNVA